MELKQIIASIVAVVITAFIVYRNIPRGRKRRTTKKSETDSKKPI